jgi:hypothetical protein
MVLEVLRAVLEALEGPRNAQGQPPRPSQAPPAVAAPIDQQLIALASDVAALKTEMLGLRAFIKEEADRAERASERTRKLIARDRAEREAGELEPDAGEDVHLEYGGPGAAGGVQPVRGVLEGPRAQSAEEIRAAARRAVAFT